MVKQLIFISKKNEMVQMQLHCRQVGMLPAILEGGFSVPKVYQQILFDPSSPTPLALFVILPHQITGRNVLPCADG